MQYKEAVDLISNFTKEYLNGNIYNLRTFHFIDLRGDVKYGGGNIDDFSEFRILKAFNKALYKQKWDKFYHPSCGKTKSNHPEGGGKVLIINTKQTLYDYLGVSDYYSLKKYVLPRTTINKIHESIDLTWTIGNILIFPLHEEGESALHCIKREPGWSSDKFLGNIYDRFVKQEPNNTIIGKSLDRMFADYPNLFNDHTSMMNFARINFLEDYFDKDGVPLVNFADKIDPEVNLNREELINHIDRFWDILTRLIVNRTDRIIEALKRILEEYENSDETPIIKEAFPEINNIRSISNQTTKVIEDNQKLLTEILEQTEISLDTVNQMIDILHRKYPDRFPL